MSGKAQKVKPNMPNQEEQKEEDGENEEDYDLVDARLGLGPGQKKNAAGVNRDNELQN